MGKRNVKKNQEKKELSDTLGREIVVVEVEIALGDRDIAARGLKWRIKEKQITLNSEDEREREEEEEEETIEYLVEYK